MLLAGEIKAKGPELRKSETQFETKGMEFDLETKEAKNPELGRFSVWVRTLIANPLRKIEETREYESIDCQRRRYDTKI